MTKQRVNWARASGALLICALVAQIAGAAVQEPVSLCVERQGGSAVKGLGPYELKASRKYRVSFKFRKAGRSAFDIYYQEKDGQGALARKRRWIFREDREFDDWREFYFTFNSLVDGQVVFELALLGPGDCVVKDFRCADTGRVLRRAAAAREPAELLEDPGFEATPGAKVYRKAYVGEGWLGVAPRPGYAVSMEGAEQAPEGNRYVYLEGESGLHQEVKHWQRDATYSFSVLARGQGQITLYVVLSSIEDGRRHFMFSQTASWPVSNEWKRYSLYWTADNEVVKFISPRIDTSGRLYLDGASFRAVALEAIPPDGHEVAQIQLDVVLPEVEAAKGPKDRICFLKGLYYDKWGIEQIAAAYGAMRNFDFMASNVGDVLFPPLLEASLARARLVIIADVDEPALGDTSNLLQFVRSGGALLYLGGLYSFGHGRIRSDALKGLLPVHLADTPFDMVAPEPGVIEPGDDLEDKEAFAWEQGPVVKYIHRIGGLKDGSSVWLKVSGQPLLVVREVGEGRVAAFTGTLYGDYGHALPFWQWRDWPKLMRKTISWLLD